MRYVSAYLLALAGGNQSPKLEDLKNILGAVGVDTDVEAAKLVISRLQGKSIEEVIAEGSSGLVTVGIGSSRFLCFHLLNFFFPFFFQLF
ncbi:hypothetical protein ANCDUO_18645 [Ancylostoma duodenale]|uniref:Large ribosomal subunit protein P2 n=1 Tax=Ancylostoma duodenale TaxID=51022 RepID=A0A0C2FRR9_9BILA|nr:hypothetical protein ANCDUO_18645 [Ancylostoma duodenale]